MEPDAELAKVLDECLDRIKEGKPVDVCVAASPRLHDKVAPLLYTGYYIATTPKVQPSEEFRRTAKQRLLARLNEEERMVLSNKAQEKHGPSFFEEFGLAMNNVWQTFVGARRIALPVAIGLILIIVSAFGVKNFMSPSPALADGCTLSLISGTVEITRPSAASQTGTNGMTLGAGTRVKTAPDSSALLTFFDGSTLELKPGTDIEIQKLESSDGKAVTIVLKQWVGRTWSTVVKMADKGSRYEIDTPSAVALVRGTQFVVDVDNNGHTREHTTRGLVSVFAQGQEVLVPPGQATKVEKGTPPSEPVITPDPEDTPQDGQQQGNQGGASDWAQNYKDTNQGGASDWGQSNGNKGGVSDWAQSEDKEGNASDWGQSNSNKGGASDWGQSNGNDLNNGNDNNNSGGNANANGSDNGNSGGNANGNNNSNSSDNGNANGSNNSNSSGNGNSNAGGNSSSGSGNSGNAGNSGNSGSAGGSGNAGGNSGSSSGGSGGAGGGSSGNSGGNGNAGGNGNGKNG